MTGGHPDKGYPSDWHIFDTWGQEYLKREKE